MKELIIKTPAKINLTLEVLNKREDGYHNIQSIMQTVSLYDFLAVKIKYGKGLNIILSGNSEEIPYDNKNLVHKAAVKFFEEAEIKNVTLNVEIRKNIPVAAGLAGGSANAAGILYTLNKLYDYPLTNEQINQICAQLGSDINFCLQGGCALCTSRGESIEQLPVYVQDVSLIKPKNLGISAKDAYAGFSESGDKSVPNNTQKLKILLEQNSFDKNLLYNSLEKAMLVKYKQLKAIKDNIEGSLMTGSGSTFFVLSKNINKSLLSKETDYTIIENLKTIREGITEN